MAEAEVVKSKKSKVESKAAAKPKAIKPKKERKDGATKKTSAVETKTTQKAEVELNTDHDALQPKTSNLKPTPTAKAGKRSEKALKETEEKLAKEARKATVASDKDASDDKPKVQQKPARSKLERKSKKFRQAAELIESGKVYGLNEAIELAAKTSPVNFDATVELHIRLGVDPRQADQNIRDMVVLPAGTGKSVRVAVFADPDGVAAAKKAGADIAAGDEFLQELDKGVLNFDILVATPALMSKLGKYARVLGPKGLMPNPKSGTVTNDVAKAVTEAKAGRVEYRVDSTGIVHVGVGKVSFGATKLLQNTQAILGSIKNNKPSSLKGNYVRSIYVTTSMGPSISIAVSEL